MRYKRLGKLVEKYGRWSRWFDDPMEDLFCQAWMTLTIIRVLACVVKGAKMSGECTRTQRQIGERTGLEQPHVARALKVLRTQGVLYQARPRGPYFLALPYFYRGAEAQIDYWQKQEAIRRTRGVTRNGQAQTSRSTRVPAPVGDA
jgi:DNA-binding IclR family transcriptional regulator